MDMKNISDGNWSFFASRTSIQELYINPHLLTPAMWDCLAAAAKWADENAHVLQDVHWIGGDPKKEEIYGYAAWNPAKGLFSLRNPSEKPQKILIDLQKIFELPENANPSFKITDAIHPENSSSEIKAEKGKTFEVELAPFELQVLDAVPVRGK